MKRYEPDFLVLEYITITKAPRTGLVVAIGGTEFAADILQRTEPVASSPPPGTTGTAPGCRTVCPSSSSV
ncbi:hypothetical protein OG554_05340 [Streptomyces griseus]|uniref:hypothetical protein n=1 Tax=Streptomyces griseus TaxID=1911 RepID=UPI00386FBBB8|nr:hypothetical protein OG554_05340 [Streptomyces fimicarius]